MHVRRCDQTLVRLGNEEHVRLDDICAGKDDIERRDEHFAASMGDDVLVQRDEDPTDDLLVANVWRAHLVQLPVDDLIPVAVVGERGVVVVRPDLPRMD